MSKRETCFNCLDSVANCDCGETETYSTEKPHCPHCGGINHDYDDPDPRFYEDGEFDLECDDCGKQFRVSVFVSQSYTCTRGGRV